ncbi:DUF2125 domain-containing protein [Citreicella sp. C3M06]|uniref:DUF2125 domain-containing protein n=1 Tax=Citreicella sp. C3M06 TaxID=2841564 RepID=UPI001C0A2808|nr:DUF2125 domain-containing protein [Citreicella sp. C3M06]MBU2962578.1 DUF2125 domain-containing protein [Citreicella sp. C3M06]
MLVSKQGLAVAAMALCLGHPALAEVSPEQVWQELEAYVTDMGYDLRASQSRAGGALRLSDVAIHMPFPEGDGEMTAQIGEMLLTPDGGAVKVALPARFPITLTATPKPEEDIEAVDMTIEVSLDAPEMTVSGDPGDTTWDYAFQRIGMALSELIVDDATVGRDAARAQASAGPVSGTSRMALADGLRKIDQQVSFGDLTWDLLGNDPDSANGGTLAGALTGLRSQTRASLPQGDAQNMSALLGDGFDVAATLNWDSSQTAFAVTETGSETTGSTRSGVGAVEVAMGPQGLRYDLQSADMSIELSPPGMPFPLSAAMQSFEMKLEGPVGPAEAPQDIAIGLTLGELTLSEMIWAMIDPQAVLPRDPATLALDITGKVTPYMEMFDPAKLAELDSGNVKPGELNALTLNGLTLEAAGARLSGTGAFTFDNNDLESFDGFPAPEGTLVLALSGANGLLDKLMALGLVDETQAMGTRMMLGMFAVPGNAEDSLTSTIEINGRGQILANGQRIK